MKTFEVLALVAAGLLLATTACKKEEPSKVGHGRDGDRHRGARRAAQGGGQ
jgi:hypothetical protein